MKIGFVIEALLLLIIFALLVSEIIIPMWRKRPLFPTFRGKQKVVKEMEAAREAADQADAEKELWAIWQKTKQEPEPTPEAEVNPKPQPKSQPPKRRKP